MTTSSTIGQCCITATRLLTEHGIGEPRENAERLLMHVLGYSRAQLLRDFGDPFPLAKRSDWEQLLARKVAGEPLQYLIGEQWFYGAPFTVNPAVLIPRPETELLVEAVIATVDELWSPAQLDAGEITVPTIVDVGTGSGAIAVTMAMQRPQWHVCASDLSEDALTVARANAAKLSPEAKITFVQGDLLAPFLPQTHIDVLVSNPPYIPAADMADLQVEVRDYEPHLALVGGEDGLDPYRLMVEQMQQLPSLPRVVAFELGIYQAPLVAELLRQVGYWPTIRVVHDYNGIERHVIASKPF